MSKFNTTKKGTNIIENKCGHAAYKMEDRAKLVTQVLTSFFGEQKFYGDNSNDLIQNAKQIIVTDPKFVANLTRYARKEMHLRSVSHALTALIAHELNSKALIKEVVADVVERPDDITEIMAAYLGMFGKPIPNGLKKALAKALKQFNEYSISKYNGGNKTVTFKNILGLTHAKPNTKEQEELFKKIMTDTLEVADRWETELSKNGNNKETWEKLIAENKLGYMAALRNLRNMANANPSNFKIVLDKIANKNEVLKSKQLPFRFYSAYRELGKLNIAGSNINDALEQAIQYSLENMPKLKGTTVLAIDVSGSMEDAISNKSDVKCSDIAKLLAVIAGKICENAIIVKFDTSLAKINFSKFNGILNTVDSIAIDGGGTNIALPLEFMLDNKIVADRLIMFSDNEINSGYERTCQTIADRYRRDINPNLWVHAVDLQGYGTQQFIGGKTNIISGWSEKIIEFIDLAEKGIDTQIKRIEDYDNKHSSEITDNE